LKAKIVMCLLFLRERGGEFVNCENDDIKF
jgi:hypothetical protein